MKSMLSLPWMTELTSIYCSTEQKAIDGAEILAQHLDLPISQLAELGENDRSSTGFLVPSEFEEVANAFFAQPSNSIRGWERAVDAQGRIVRAVRRLAVDDRSLGSIAIVSHGAVGTLLYCYLSGQEISRRWDQPANGGGNYFRFTLSPQRAQSHWQAIDASAL